MSGSEIVTEQYHAETCCKCGIKFWLPLALYETAVVRCEEMHFWCPNGHPQHYVRQNEDDGDPDPGDEQPEGEVVRFQVVVGGKP